MKLKFIFLLMLICTVMYGETFECVYLEGYAEFQKNGVWVPMDYGVILNTGSILQLESHSVVQLDSNNSSLLYTQEGTYYIELDTSIDQTQQLSLVSSLSSKINTLLQENDVQLESTVMGIRGDEVVLNDGLGFESTSEEDLSIAWKLIEEGRLVEAEEELELLYMLSPDPFSEGKLLFYLALVEELQGKSGEAWNHLGDIILPEQGEYYSSYLLLAGRLAFKAKNYVEAKSSFLEFLQQNPNDEVRDEIESLIAVCESQ